MENKILGLHHVTAIASNAKVNLDFYTNVLGMRLVKKTVNFDDPSTYHFYFGDEIGTPGTILTFFPWADVRQGVNGSGMATHIGYSVPQGSSSFWKDRLTQFNVPIKEEEVFGEKTISFKDPDGLNLQFIETNNEDLREAWTTGAITQEVATKGFHNVTLTLRQTEPTLKVLTDILGYGFQKQDGDKMRLVTDAIETANIIDIHESPMAGSGLNAAGTNHHIAFRVKNDDILMEFHEKVLSAGLHITPKIDRDYFFSLYFREPGGVLFELATDNPGFMRDESRAELGTNLKLPKQYEAMRSEIEEVLPDLS